ncbi:MAG: hypothetical protein A3H52_03115 [Candidatus Zambryskibacteria bacterium RIFCSPLOWO2_02_FULL_39_26]|uniref:Cell division protein FtsL n=1 Tax=Candidatus Zambryskibacteria bacterium RIFCSPLOWO2_12_FULL_39_23 TaxID=1802776 RepID=A0A1G2UTV3_9BACT|nr:MAG: hypothetical protein A2W51_02910 [Candidatus Zambryskibacteria bacterium RIFCSPHIGHO2_02_39_10]OHA98963.1 MAG: hypothetical protein A3E59_00970 [Candidatus Zambryskibacteria bacterium RIFCSPHIGHO2_12_FULL_39_47]OHB10575.1 MAG: hypothetical protein A3H52_03115 [Candidatus Zambryskibacteria bacterium RIFCSPLOWO2_02_FULL_39_26]OHB12788.1 MAG: hypothetical protein A3G99_01415 [Candidatus Zambryskibacteria bacterium RIFCSPLOWO2_12_FULL_39_23]
MLDFQQKRKVKSFMYNRVTLAVLLVVVLFVLNSTWSVYQKKRESERLKNVALGNVENLRGRNSELQVKIERLGTEVGIEEEIRSKFNVAKQEENAVIIVPKSETNATSTNSSSFWQKVKKFFGM